jgi:transcriptional regulator with XRE-family HTH domain
MAEFDPEELKAAFDAGLSQRQLAEVLRLSPAFINDLEHER